MIQHHVQFHGRHELHLAMNRIIAAAILLVGPISAQFGPPPQQRILRFRGNSAAFADRLSLSANYTIETWLWLDEPAPLAIILGKAFLPRGVDPLTHYRLGLDATGKRLIFIQSNGKPGSGVQLSATTDLTLSSWVHIAATSDNAILRLFVNATEVANARSPGLPLGAEVPFGVGGSVSDNGSPANTFKGALRQVRVWARALSANELRAGAQRTLNGGEAGLTAAWPLDDGSGLTARDLAGAQWTLRLQGQYAFWDTTSLHQNGPYWGETRFTVNESVAFAGGDGIVIPATGAIGPTVFAAFSGPELDRPGPVRAFRFGPKGFADVTAETIPSPDVGVISPRDFAVADFDGDGRPDVFLATHGLDAQPFPGGKSYLFLHAQDGTFRDESDGRIPRTPGYTHSVASADINGDGFVDLYIGELCFSCAAADIKAGNIADTQGPQIYLNDGTGHFTATNRGLPPVVSKLQKRYLTSRFVDANNDGAPDLVLGSIRGVPGNLLLINDGKGAFTEAPEDALPPKVGGIAWVTVAIAPADYDGDGLTDLILVMTEGYTGRVALQLALNNGDGTFWDASEQLGFREVPPLYPGDYWIRSVTPLDFNGDGQIDFLTSGGAGTAARLFINRGGGYFMEMSERLPFLGTGPANVVAGDFDGDGRVDLFYLFTFGNYGYARGLNPVLVP